MSADTNNWGCWGNEGCNKLTKVGFNEEICDTLSKKSTTLYNELPYYCVNYNQNAFVWKTCRPQSEIESEGLTSWVPWVSNQLACNSEGTLLNCTSKSSVLSGQTKAETCQKDNMLQKKFL